MHLSPGVFSLDVWRRRPGIRESLMYISIYPGALTDSGAPALPVSGVLFVCTTAVMGNHLTMFTVTSESRLHTPMYFLL